MDIILKSSLRMSCAWLGLALIAGLVPLAARPAYADRVEPYGERFNVEPHGERFNAEPYGERFNVEPHGEPFDAEPYGEPSDACYVVADNVHGDGVDAEGGNDALALINPYTGSEQIIGKTGTKEVEAIDFDPETGILYAADAGQLGTIDLSSGAFRPLRSKFGKGNGSLGEIAFSDVDGLAFDPTSGMLYGSVRRRHGEDLLIVIDHKTGEAVEDAFGHHVDYVVIDPVHDLEDIDDLAFDDRGRLYGTANDDGRGDHLVRIDKETGETDDLGRIREDAGLDDFEGFTSTPEGDLIGIQGGSTKDVYSIKTDGKSEYLSSLSKASDYEAVSCTRPEPEVDLTKSVDHPAPEKGDVITFTIRIKNESIRIRDILVVDKLPKGLKLLDTTESDGRVEVASDGRTVKWRLEALDPEQREKLEIRVRVETDHYMENCAVVESSDPSLSKRVMSCVSITPCESSGGGDAGVESDGNLATRLATRLFARRQDVQMKQALFAAPEPAPFEAATAEFGASKSGEIGITGFIPSTGPESSQAYTVTPADLLGLTNAISVVAVDYLRPEGRRMGALFGATSPAGILYDHAKTTCDRLGGGTLDAVSTIDIDGRTFLLSRLIHADGATDHAVSFVAYRTGGGYRIDSRFTPEEYEIPADAQEVVNLQVWSVAPQYTADLVRGVLEKMAASETLTFLNTAEHAPTAPDVYVKDGRYDRGQFRLRVANGAEPATIVVRGTTARTETDAEKGLRTDFERTIEIPGVPDGEDAVEVTLDLGRVFDAVITVEHGGGFDKLYYSDGPWSFAKGQQATVSSFAVQPEDGSSSSDGRYALERSAALSGQVTDWASLFKFLRPGGQPVDLSSQRYLEFTASGRGLVQVVLEKASIDTWDQYSYLINLSPDEHAYQIPFYRFARSTGSGGLTAEDVTLVAFYAISDRQASSPFEIRVKNVVFGGATNVAAEDPAEMPETITLRQNYPNPFNPSTRIEFSLPASAPVRLSVYDMLGREVAVLIDGPTAAGTHGAEFDAAGLSSGTYLYRLSTPSNTLTGKMLLAK